MREVNCCFIRSFIHSFVLHSSKRSALSSPLCPVLYKEWLRIYTIYGISCPVSRHWLEWVLILLHQLGTLCGAACTFCQGDTPSIALLCSLMVTRASGYSWWSFGSDRVDMTEDRGAVWSCSGGGGTLLCGCASCLSIIVVVCLHVSHCFCLAMAVDNCYATQCPNAAGKTTFTEQWHTRYSS